MYVLWQLWWVCFLYRQKNRVVLVTATRKGTWYANSGTWYANSGTWYPNTDICYANSGTWYTNSGNWYENSGTWYRNSGTWYANSGAWYPNSCTWYANSGTCLSIIFTVTNLIYYVNWCGGRDSSVGIATAYGLNGPGIESRWDEIFRTRPDWPRGPPNLLYNGYPVFTGDKAAGSWRIPPTTSSAEVKERVELYLYSLSGSSWPVIGRTVPFALLFREVDVLQNVEMKCVVWECCILQCAVLYSTVGESVAYCSVLCCTVQQYATRHCPSNGELLTETRTCTIRPLTRHRAPSNH